jgi:hypothetical protein
MPPSGKDLGKLIAVYGPAPAFLQRAVFLTVLSFLFFLGTMFIYYIRQGFVYFILASAFLVVYLISLISFISQRKNFLEVREHGLKFKNNSVIRSEVESVSDDGVVQLKDQSTFTIPKSLDNYIGVIAQVRSSSQH